MTILMIIYASCAAVMFFGILGYMIKMTPATNLFALIFIAAIGSFIWPAIVIAMCVKDQQ